MKIKEFCKKEKVLVIASAAAGISAFLVHPDREYIGYMNFSVLTVLFCLMIVVGWFRETGILDMMTDAMLRVANGTRKAACLLITATAVAAMFVTNDVALLTFVPITIGLMSGKDAKTKIDVIVLETIGANLGSMLTPVGNPQNLYLYSFYQMNIGDFLRGVLPYGILGMVLVYIPVFFLKEDGKSDTNTLHAGMKTADEKNSDGKMAAEKTHAKFTGNKLALTIYTILFAICILTVVRFCDYRICLAVTIAATLILAPKLLGKADYCLILTFVAFFIFTGNMGRISAVEQGIRQFMQGREFLTSVLVSQVISNVPAAIMLSGFSDQSIAILQGTDIGGLGTLVASLASLISYKFYADMDGADGKRYLVRFTVYNVVILAVLCGVKWMVG